MNSRQIKYSQRNKKTHRIQYFARTHRNVMNAQIDLAPQWISELFRYSTILLQNTQFGKRKIPILFKE